MDDDGALSGSEYQSPTFSLASQAVTEGPGDRALDHADSVPATATYCPGSMMRQGPSSDANAANAPATHAGVSLGKKRPKPGMLKQVSKEDFRRTPIKVDKDVLQIYDLRVTRDGLHTPGSAPESEDPTSTEALPLVGSVRASPGGTNPLTRCSSSNSSCDSLGDWQATGTSSGGQPILSLNNPRHKRRLRYEDVQQNGRVLGAGATGVVYKVKDPQGYAYAKKVIQVDPEAASQIRAELQAVVSAHQCPNILKSYGAFFVDGVLSIITEYMNVGSLADVIEKLCADHVIPDDPLRCILYQVLLALDFLHTAKSGGRKRPQIHRDIKPANVLLNERGSVKLSDFGCMKQSNNTFGCVNSFIGTRVYMSPERLRGESYSASADIWSVGVVALECTTGQAAFCQKGPFEVLQAVERPLVIPSTVDPSLADLIRACLQQDPQQRPTARSLLACPFLQPVAADPAKPLQDWLQGLKGVIVAQQRRPT